MSAYRALMINFLLMDNALRRSANKMKSRKRMGDANASQDSSLKRLSTSVKQSRTVLKIQTFKLTQADAFVVEAL